MDGIPGIKSLISNEGLITRAIKQLEQTQKGVHISSSSWWSASFCDILDRTLSECLVCASLQGNTINTNKYIDSKEDSICLALSMEVKV